MNKIYGVLDKNKNNQSKINTKKWKHRKSNKSIHTATNGILEQMVADNWADVISKQSLCMYVLDISQWSAKPTHERRALIPTKKNSN